MISQLKWSEMEPQDRGRIIKDYYKPIIDKGISFIMSELFVGDTPEWRDNGLSYQNPTNISRKEVEEIVLLNRYDLGRTLGANGSVFGNIGKAACSVFYNMATEIATKIIETTTSTKGDFYHGIVVGYFLRLQDELKPILGRAIAELPANYKPCKGGQLEWEEWAEWEREALKGGE